MLSNKEVSRLFKTLSGLMELHGENDFKAKSYANNAFQIGRVSKNVMELSLSELESTQGIGKSAAAKIIELQESGSMQVLEELYQKTPPGILEILNIKGLGGKKVSVIWNELGIESIGELLYACNENRLILLKGFGEKTQQSVLESIEYYQSNIGKFHFAKIEMEAETIIEVLQKKYGVNTISLVGDVRRKCNIIERIEILCAIDSNAFVEIQTLDFFHQFSIHENKIECKTKNEIPVVINNTSLSTFYYQLFIQTGCTQHVNHILLKLNDQTTFNSEKDIYQAAGYSYIPPEFRENELDINSFVEEKIITEKQIHGIVHNHSKWSDGKHTIEEMALACIESSYSYFVISDHSKTAIYAGGLSEDSVLKQHAEIELLNQKYFPFKIYKSIESDILNDGSLDYDDAVLKEFDLIIASIHSNLKMDVEKATNRLIKAIENPYTTILGHMTGRLLLSRQGYPIHHKKIIEACAFNHVAIEINANPYRLDMDSTWIPFALQKRVLISVNPDAHSTDGIRDIHFGIISARKGFLTKEMTLNALTQNEFEIWLHERKKKKGI